MASIFSRIVAGEIPCYKVAETDNCLAFLDINPVQKGHVLCIPKKEVDYIFDMDSESYAELTQFARHVALGIKKVVPCRKVGVAVIGLDVPHTHIHLIPLQEVHDLDFRHHVEMKPEELQALAAEIQKAVG